MKSVVLALRPVHNRRSVRRSLHQSPFLRLSSLEASHSKSSPDLGPDPQHRSLSCSKVPPVRRRYFCLRDSESVYDLSGKSVAEDMHEASAWTLTKEESPILSLRRVSKLLETRLKTVVSDRKVLQRVSLEPVSSLPARILAFQEVKRGNSHTVRKLILQFPGLVRAVDAVSPKVGAGDLVTLGVQAEKCRFGAFPARARRRPFQSQFGGEVGSGNRRVQETGLSLQRNEDWTSEGAEIIVEISLFHPRLACHSLSH